MTHSHWADQMPAFRGTLPSGERVRRTEAGGNLASPLVILGLYPSAAVQNFQIGGELRKLPYKTESTSFEVGTSSSARHLDTKYLEPLGITRRQVMLLDVFPYLLLNRARAGRSMANNVRAYETLYGVDLGLQTRPHPEQSMLDMAQQLPGNLLRLCHHLGSGPTSLVLTLGLEAAAFICGDTFKAAQAKDARGALFYQPPMQQTFGTCTFNVIHLVHTGCLMNPRASARRQTHEAWCHGEGAKFVRAALSIV